MNLSLPTFLAILLIATRANALFVHENVQGVNENSEILSIEIEYDDVITSTHTFPDSFWIEITSSKTNETRKFEFDKSSDPLANEPVKMWINDVQAENTFSLHKNTEWDKESWTVYKLVNGGDAFGVATLIKNEDSSHNKFRMLGSVTFGTNYIEIVPIVTNRQQERSKRSADSSGESEAVELKTQYDGLENTHLVEIREYPEVAWAEPLIAATHEKYVKTVDDLPEMISRKKRQTGRVVKYVEAAAVLDKSITDYYKNRFLLTDPVSVRSYARLFFTQIFMKINSFYEKSFENNTQYSYSVTLTGMIIYENNSVTTWSDPYLFGQGAVLYNGRETLDASLSLSNFSSYMQKIETSLPFSFDVAAAFYNKDMYSGSSYSVAGLAWLGTVCSSSLKYSVNELASVATTAFIAAHEIGHNLGAEHDGTGASASCPSDAFIMGPSGGTNMLFSSCSMQAFLNRSLTVTCLSNIPTPHPDYQIAPSINWGQLYDADAQCRIINGNDSYFARFTQSSLCSSLFCYKDRNSTTAWSTGTAFDGTTCDSGKWCLQGQCISNSSAPTGTCLFGDAYITGSSGTYAMTCEDGLYSRSAANKKTLKTVCQEVGTSCCSTCKKYTDMVDCYDYYSNCATDLKGSCWDSNIFDKCRITCQNCSFAATCAMFGNKCLNGATCVDQPNGRYGFICQCPAGFYGGVCEYRKPILDLSAEAALNGELTTPAGTSTQTTTRIQTTTTVAATTSSSTLQPTTITLPASSSITSSVTTRTAVSSSTSRQAQTASTTLNPISTASSAYACPTGDSYVSMNDLTYSYACDAIVWYSSPSYNRSPKLVCAQPYFAEKCCSTCKKYNAAPDCSDTISSSICSNYTSYCADLVFTYNGSRIADICRATCGSCSNTVTCELYGSLCQNGAYCVNRPSGQNSFTCSCTNGYYGALCEYRIPATSSTSVRPSSTTTTRTTTRSATTRSTTTVIQTLNPGVFTLLSNVPTATPITARTRSLNPITFRMV